MIAECTKRKNYGMGYANRRAGEGTEEVTDGHSWWTLMDAIEIA